MSTGADAEATAQAFGVTESHWPAHLSLDYRRGPNGRTVLHDRHSGPMRVLKSLYPEGLGICHTVLVHPPGGVAGGDRLHIDAKLGPDAHALVTTPGATRFYRSDGALAKQTLRARLAAGARLEWLSLETLVHRGAVAENHLRFELDDGAEMIGWDVIALGLPASAKPFTHGRLTQCIELPGVWLERAVIHGQDTLLLDSPLGWAGRRVLATMWFAAGRPIAAARRDALLTMTRTTVDADATLAASAGVTSTAARLVVVRALAPNVESAVHLFTAVRHVWRTVAWNCNSVEPRVWST